MRIVTALLLGLSLAFVAMPAAEIAAPTEARADADESRGESSSSDFQINVGTELMALANVSLNKAEILKGSKVSVAKVMESGGQIEGALVELADGHMVKVAASTLRSLFSVVH